ncbi:DNRLRE domain-containing protein, partial [candidate division KSB1 bacterium]|nr:DNRLRE domain-containing protein [candidate division KSB1 bacterium]NIR68370.1 DNRLRE domain-containing protein [candidate division KSB1 bacterium]NIS25314.1 DNRLRE domain-containing protein [candidate division KSB1 bacterium]NIT72225.1 DNRLRE domain-containing protein [candidate division KSB1 bacterium]NIU26033.1 DNRLRE domain-containing protein [candidate division KSB1 bacterium]
NPTDDAYVRSSRPAENNADDPQLKVRETSVDRISYLKFNVSGLPGNVQSAKLRVFVSDESGDGGSTYYVSNSYKDSDTPWTEDGLVWDNAPEIDGEPLSSLGAVPLNEVVEFDVSSAVTGNGEFSFAIENNSSDIVIYSSKEGSVVPELLVESIGSGGSTAIPIITSLTPASGVIGSEVTISGSNFIDVTSVTFNETFAATFSVDSESQIRAVVPGDATSGPISVTNSDGTGISPDTFTVIAPPAITSFTPTDGPINTQVTIIGENFTGVTEVSFNGNAATDYTIDSDTQIRATVPDGTTSGPIHVSNEAGTATSITFFTITAPPSTITLHPIEDTFVQSTRSDKNYGDDDELRVRESSDTDYNAYVKFNVSGIGGAPNSAVLRLHVIDDGPEGGRLHTVSNNHLDSSIPWTEESLVWDNAPLLTGSPLVTLGAVGLGEVVEIDITSVITGDGVYSFSFTNDTWDAAKYSSKEGVVAPELVIEPSGSASPIPAITDFAPKSGGVGTEVTITGRSFADVTEVLFNGAPAGTFTIDSDTQIRASVPEGATTGNLTVQNSEGSDSSDETFEIISPPEITAFTPTSGPVGTKVTITGSNFTGVSSVSFDGELATDFTIFSVLEIHAIVPESATTGKISVTNSAGTAISLTEYEVIAAPTLSSFTPTSGVVGTVVTLSGTNFTAITSVAFNGTAASQFAVDSETSIRAEVPSGAGTGPITVKNGDGTGTSIEDFIVIEPPIIDAFTPESGSVGTVVTITGSHF